MRVELRDTTDRRACVDMLRQVEAHAVDGDDIADMIEGCALLDVVEDGAIVGAVAVRIEGAAATITAAASSGSATYVELALIERLLSARGVRRVGMFTCRPGLVRRLLAQGYAIAECELVKEINGQPKIQ